jgi:hypothetical protein
MAPCSCLNICRSSRPGLSSAYDSAFFTPMIKAAFAATRQKGKLSNDRVVGSRDHQKGIVIVVVGLMLAVSCDFSRRQTAPQV